MTPLRLPMLLLCLALPLSAAPAASPPGCAGDAEIARFVGDWQAHRPTGALAAGGTMEDALCTQGKLARRLAISQGRVVGYKAGLTSAATQARFGVTEPVRGVLMQKMLLDDGARVSAEFGARPLFEADLLLVVGDEAVNAATTVEEALAHISAVRPFIELPDLALAEGEPIDGVTLTAANVGARLGVMGEALPMSPPVADALASMVVRVTDGAGLILAETKGEAVLGHPVRSLLWLLEKGVRFKAGDLVSVGSIGPLLPPSKARGTATVTYEGLPGNPTVSVTFH